MKSNPSIVDSRLSDSRNRNIKCLSQKQKNNLTVKLPKSLTVRFQLSSMLLILMAARAVAAPFQNLDFEQAVLQTAPANFVPWDARTPIDAAAALPFWTAREDSQVLTAVWDDSGALDQTSVALVRTKFLAVRPPLDGQYSVHLTSWAGAFAPYFKVSSISQIGDVPAGTHSIRFLLQAGFEPPYLSGPAVTLNGQAIRTSQLSMTGNVAMMIGDVSTFAGTTAELEFQCDGAGKYIGENFFTVDDISFSPAPAPILSIITSSTNISVVWPASLTNYVLETTSNLASPATWTTVTSTLDIAGETLSVSVYPVAGGRFFRLRGP
jgi:hypothetical protein